MDYINYVKQSPMSMGGMGGVVGSYNFRSAAGGGSGPGYWDGGRILAAGGDNGGNISKISYIGATGSSLSTFGNLVTSRLGFGGASNGERVVWSSGQDSGGYTTSTIDYVTSSSTGDATDFGEDIGNWGYTANLSDSTTAVMGGGWNGSSRSNNMRYVTIATTGNATNFGDLVNAGSAGGGCCNGTRGIFGGIKPAPGTDYNIIQYLTVATPANATDFGNLTQQRWGVGACANSTRAVFGGGYGSPSTMDYVTISSTGNASSFGTMSPSGNGNAGASDTSQSGASGRGYFIGGEGSSGAFRYIDISSTGSSSSMATLSGHGNFNYIAGSSGNA